MVVNGAVLVDAQGNPLAPTTTENTPPASTLLARIAQLEKQVAGISVKKGPRKLNKDFSSQVKDLQTGIVYPSKAQLGYALSTLGKAAGSWAGQTMITEHPERFVVVGQIKRKPFEKSPAAVVPAAVPPTSPEVK
jgi:hypothetical protein